MALLNFQMPDRVIMNDTIENVGIFEFRPLEPGFGLTTGNALRRVLLSSLKGYAITNIKVDGVNHEFSTIKGVTEDLTEIILNLKQIRFKPASDDLKTETFKIKISNTEVFKAGDLQSYLTGFTIVNPELVICNMVKSTTLQMEITVEEGRGYALSEDNKKEDMPIGFIAIDSLYTPIKNVSYRVENYRVGQKTDFEKLILEITTDGTILPKDALTEAAKVLIKHFMLFSEERISLESEMKSRVEEYDEESLVLRQTLKAKLADLKLSVRALNCLKSAEIETLGDLVSFAKSDLMKFRNFGKKSLVELEELVENKGLKFGMDLAKYKL